MRWLFLLAGILLAPLAHAQTGLTLMGAGGAASGTTCVSSFTGPGNIVSGATNFYSVARGYNNAYACPGTGKAMTVRAVGGTNNGLSTDIVILNGGDIDVASANAWATTDATCTGTISGTTLSCTGASSTPHAGSTVDGVGVNQPVNISSCGTFTGGTGTCTLSVASTVGTPETITMRYPLFVSKLYDQSGNAVDLAQSNTALQPQWFPVCNNAKPCVYFSAGPTLVAASGASVPQPYSFSVEAYIITNNAAVIIGSATATVNSSGTAGQWQLFQASGVNFSAADSAWHSTQGVFNGASSHAYVDGVSTNSLSPGTGASNTLLSVGAYTNGLSAMNGLWAEGGQWAVGFTGTTNGNTAQTGLVCQNQQAYYGGTGC